MTDMARDTLFELIKLFVSGILGGVIGGQISFRLFTKQKRFETKRDDQIKRREALRDIDLILQWIYGDIYFDWKWPINEKQSEQEYKTSLVNKINYCETLFLDDPEMSVTLQQLLSLIGADSDSFYGEDKEFEETPFELVHGIRTSVRQKIVEIEGSIT